MQPPGDRFRILLITRNLPPLVGGMERLLQNLAYGIAQYAEITVIGPKGCSKHLPDDVTVHETSSKLVPFLLGSTLLALVACRKTPFTVIIGGSGLTAPTLRILSSFFGRKTLVLLHGLDLVVSNVAYQSVFIPCIRKIDHVIANSRNTQNIAIEKGVPEEHITIVHPGTDFPDIPGNKELADFREQHGIHFDKTLVFVGRMTKRKGLSSFIQKCLPTILAAEPEAGLLVVGSSPNDSLNGLSEQTDILSLVDSFEGKERILFLGQVNDADLISSYALANVQIFPVTEVAGDVEGFGMIAIEAAACGTPTVAFNLGGVSDAISASNGKLIQPDRYDLFAEAVIDTLRTNTPSADKCLEHAKNFSWDSYNEKLEECARTLVQPPSPSASL